MALRVQLELPGRNRVIRCKQSPPTPLSKGQPANGMLNHRTNTGMFTDIGTAKAQRLESPSQRESSQAAGHHSCPVRERAGTREVVTEVAKSKGIQEDQLIDKLKNEMTVDLKRLVNRKEPITFDRKSGASNEAQLKR